MKLLKPLFLGALISLTVISCSQDDINPNKMEITGIIQKQGMTTYQYGTHTISGYALRSDVINLDDYENQHVTVVGRKIDGYPISGGPDYIEVEEIR